MIRLAFTFFVLGSLILMGQAFAGPAYRAEMVQLDEDGKPVSSLYHFSLEMNQRGERVTSFNFTETYGSPCPPGAMCILGFSQVSREFKVVRQSLDKCGGTVYSAEYLEPQKGKRFKRSISRMELRDHRMQLCKNLVRYQWELNVTEANQMRRSFYGNPENVKPVADCSAISQNTICTMEYAPAVCQTSSLNGEALASALVAKSGNPCFAMAKVREAACERGLDWQALRDEEMACAFAR